MIELMLDKTITQFVVNNTFYYKPLLHFVMS